MVSGERIEVGTQILSARVRKTIQSIKEIVGNHSDADIYLTLKESNMDPNETAQKLLNQDPFHEVRRKKDKRKEITSGYKVSTTPDTRKPVENEAQGTKVNSYSHHNVQRGTHNRNSVPGFSKKFRVVRDNRVNHNANSDTNLPSLSSDELMMTNVPEKSSTGTSGNQGLLTGRSFQPVNGAADSQLTQAGDANSMKILLEEGQPSVANAASWIQAMKSHDSQSHSTTSSNNSVVGVYSSSSDPVHVPSLDSRSPANIGAIRREVGVVGGRRQLSESTSKVLPLQTSTVINLQPGREGFSAREPSRSFMTTSKKDQPNQNSISESTVSNVSSGRNFLSNNYYGKQHQQLGGHQKASHSNKEWKPKSSQKPNAMSSGVTAQPVKSVAPSDNGDLSTEATQLQDKLSLVNISENQNVIIAAHIRVSDTDRSRLTFGSFGTVYDPHRNSGSKSLGSAEEQHVEPSVSLSATLPESSNIGVSGGKQMDLVDDQIRKSGSSSPASGLPSEHQVGDNKESASRQNFDIDADIGLVEDGSQSYTPTNSQQHQDVSELPGFSAYDPQTGYDMSFFRPTVDEAVRGQGLPSPQEELSSQSVNNLPTSSVPMMQQQQQPIAQVYPQVHLPHFANLMPYHRQFISPVYVPSMAMPGYSSNAAYPHPSNGSSYLLMTGGGSHLPASGLKYGIQQFKPVPSGSPTGFGNFTSPTGYAINAAAGVGALEDSSRLKYKDSNLYVPNQQAEPSEIWMNPRELPSLQSASYYNMTGQTPHATYLPSHTGHASFNAAAAVAQSSHMQFPGLYHPPQPTAIANPHHMGPGIGGNVGVGIAAAAPGAQVGGYQQPQMGHLNWTGNF